MSLAARVAVAFVRPKLVFSRSAPGSLPEIMDDPDCDLADLRDALEAIDRAGRWSGRDRLLLGDARRLLARLPPGPLDLLDVGCGGGAATDRLAGRLAASGWRPRLVLADLHARTLRIARQRPRGGTGPGTSVPATSFVRLDAPRLPFADGSFDLAISSSTLHHLETRDATRLLAELARVSRIGFSVVDLRRSWLVYAVTRGLAATVWRRRPYPRRDGPVSIRRAFTTSEARALLGSAGLEDGRVRVRPAWIAIRWKRSGAAGAAVEVRSRARPPLARSLSPAAPVEA